MNIYDQDYDDNDYSKMMEETGRMLNQFDFLKKKIVKEYDQALKIKILSDDNAHVSLYEYESMLEERNKVINATRNNIRTIDANISYLKDIGNGLLVKTGVLTEEEYRKSNLLNLILETIDEKNKDLVETNIIINEYNELKLNREVDMLVVIEDTSYFRDYQVSELEDKYNEASEEINHIDKQLFGLEMLKAKIVNDLGALTYIIDPKENENDKTKKKKKGE